MGHDRSSSVATTGTDAGSGIGIAVNGRKKIGSRSTVVGATVKNGKASKLVYDAGESNRFESFFKKEK